jgi:hypothetical protein
VQASPGCSLGCVGLLVCFAFLVALFVDLLA